MSSGIFCDPACSPTVCNSSILLKLQVLCADLTLQQHLPKPSASLLGRASRVMSSAADRVRKGELLDHSKQKQLRQSLLQMATMFPVRVCKCQDPAFIQLRLWGITVEETKDAARFKSIRPCSLPQSCESCISHQDEACGLMQNSIFPWGRNKKKNLASLSS